MGAYRDDLRRQLERARGPAKARIEAQIKAGWHPGRCKDCPAKAPKGKSRCRACESTRAEAARELRAERRRQGLCTTCGDPAVKLPDGTVLSMCERHREYFSAAARAGRAGR